MQDPQRVAGILLVSSFLILLLALVILIASNALPAFSAVLRGSLAEMAPFADTFRLLNLFWTVGWILQLMGLGLLTHLLMKAGEEQLAILSFILVFVATILGVLHGTFHMSVDTWASQQTVHTGSIPEAYGPLEVWIGAAFRIAYVLHLTALFGSGWAILRAEFLASWVGWLVIGWSALWLLGSLVGLGAPAILFFMPALIGAVLLW